MLLLLHLYILCFRMEKRNKIPQEVDLCVTTVILHELQQLESEITKAEEMLQYLEATGTRHKTSVHERRKYLKEYLNVLYQVRAFYHYQQSKNIQQHY